MAISFPASFGSRFSTSGPLDSVSHAALSYTPPVGSFTTFAPIAPSGQGSSFNGTGSRLIYVSSSTGSSGGDGSLANPLNTIAAGAALLRNGFPDQLLLKRGDTFPNTDNINIDSGEFRRAGVSPTQPMVWGAYGSGARPVVKVPIGGSGLNLNNRPEDGNNMVVQGIEFYASTRDPGSPDYAGAATAAADTSTIGLNVVSTHLTWFMIEDCKFSYFAGAINAYLGDYSTPFSALPPSTLILNRNIIIYSYCGAAHSQGIFLVGVQNFTCTENFFDHNGWTENAALVAANAGCAANAYNRNIYDANEGQNLVRTVTRTVWGNILARSSQAGAQFRCGGDIHDNFCFLNYGPGFDVGENYGTSVATNSTTSGARARNNVILNSLDDSNIPAWAVGIQLANTTGALVDGNIFAHNKSSQSSGSSAAAIWWDPSQATGNNALSGTATNNLIFDGTAYTDTSNTYITIGAGNYKDEAGTNAGGAPEPFPHPSPTAVGATSLVGDYYKSIGGTVNDVDFLAACAARAGGAWPSNLSAVAVNAYVAQGFNKTFS